MDDPEPVNLIEAAEPAIQELDARTGAGAVETAEGKGRL